MTLVRYAKHHPSNQSYDTILNKIIDAGHLGIWRAILNNFMFYKDGKKRNILQTGMPGSDLDTVESYLKQILHCFTYCGEDHDFDHRLYMPDYQHQIVLLDETAEPTIFDTDDTCERLKILVGQGFPAKPNHYYKQHILKQMFNFFTMQSLPEDLDLHTYKDDDHLRYIDKKQLRSHFEIVMNRPMLAPKRKFPYSTPMAAKYLLEEAYMFQLEGSPSKN